MKQEWFTITAKFITDGASNAGGGWTKQQLAILGVTWPPKEGWRDRVVGNQIPAENAKKFLALKGSSASRKVLNLPEEVGAREPCDSDVVTAYADGGVCGPNPSPIGGTWAYVFIDAAGKCIFEDSGVVFPDEPGLPTITNNFTELWACMLAVEALPVGWAGTLHTDSFVTLCRITNPKAGFHGIPDAVRERFSRCLSLLGKGFRVVLLDGHPTKEQLDSGIGKRGNPCSKFNVRCDELCNQQARKVMEREALKS